MVVMIPSLLSLLLLHYPFLSSQISSTLCLRLLFSSLDNYGVAALRLGFMVVMVAQVVTKKEIDIYTHNSRLGFI